MVFSLSPSGLLGRRSVILFLLGFLGVVSILTVPLALPAGQELPLSETAIRILSVVQGSVFLLIAVVIGHLCAPRVGFSTPLIERVTGRFRGEISWQPLAVSGVAWGVISAVIIGILATLARPLLPESFVAAGEQASTPLVARLLYGGITEEILLRWGMMSLLAWLYWRLWQRGRGDLTAAGAWLAIIGAAVLFGVGHLPAAAVLAGQGGLSLFLVVYIISLNALFGLGAGWLFWRKGLEAAIIAHMTFHVVIVAAESLAQFV